MDVSGTILSWKWLCGAVKNSFHKKTSIFLLCFCVLLRVFKTCGDIQLPVCYHFHGGQGKWLRINNVKSFLRFLHIWFCFILFFYFWFAVVKKNQWCFYVCLLVNVRGSFSLLFDHGTIMIEHRPLFYFNFYFLSLRFDIFKVKNPKLAIIKRKKKIDLDNMTCLNTLYVKNMGEYVCSQRKLRWPYKFLSEPFHKKIDIHQLKNISKFELGNFQAKLLGSIIGIP